MLRRSVATLYSLFALVFTPAWAAETLLFDWSGDRCSTWDIPDTPARFWRLSDGTIGMVAGSENSRASFGDNPAHLQRSCQIVLRGSGSSDPAARDDRVWIASVFTADGTYVEAIGHAEFHGHRHIGRCAAGTYMECWRNALVALESRDGGRSFRRVERAPIAALPYHYSPMQTARSGYFNPSNLLAWRGHLYMFFFAEAYGAQERGVCVARRVVADPAADWWVWDGREFSAKLADPYDRPVLNPENHVCAPLPGLSSTLSSVVFQPSTGRFLAVSPTTRRDLSGVRHSGFWAWQSKDLIHWHSPVLLREAPLLWRRACEKDHVHAYPAMIDPTSRDRNFTTVDARFWLTFVRMPLDEACRVGPERDLVRIDINWPETPDAPPAPQAPAQAQSDQTR